MKRFTFCLSCVVLAGIWSVCVADAHASNRNPDNGVRRLPSPPARLRVPKGELFFLPADLAVNRVDIGPNANDGGLLDIRVEIKNVGGQDYSGKARVWIKAHHYSDPPLKYFPLVVSREDGLFDDTITFLKAGDTLKFKAQTYRDRMYSQQIYVWVDSGDANPANNTGGGEYPPPQGNRAARTKR